MVRLGASLVKCPKLHGPLLMYDEMEDQALSPQIKIIPGGNWIDNVLAQTAVWVV